MREYKPNYPNSKVRGYDILSSSVNIYCKDGTIHEYNATNLGEERLAMIKTLTLSGANLDALISGQYTFIV